MVIGLTMNLAIYLCFAQIAMLLLIIIEVKMLINHKCVETIHLLPKSLRYGKDIVQTTTSFDGYSNIEW